MAIIHQHDKRTGITYVYESKSYYDKEKKCSRAKRTLIGKLDPETNEIIPTDGRNRNRVKKTPEEAAKESLEIQLQKLTEENLQLKAQVSALTEEIRRLSANKSS